MVARGSALQPSVKKKVSTPFSYNLGMNQSPTSDFLPSTVQLSSSVKLPSSDLSFGSDKLFPSDQLPITEKHSSSQQSSGVQLPSSDLSSGSEQLFPSGQLPITEQHSSSPQSSSVQLASPSPELSSSDQLSSSGQVPPKTRATYMTKSRKIFAKKKVHDDKCSKFELAFKSVKDGSFKSIRECSKFYNLFHVTLSRMVKSGAAKYKGSGKFSCVLTSEEEKLIIDHVVWRQEVGCGLSFEQLGLLLQEVFLGLKEANPDRLTGFEKTNHLPYPNWVRRFAERHSIVLRCSVEISKGRQILTARDLELWQQDTEAYLLSNPVFAECFKDPSRLFNQDESSIELGSGSRRVLAKRGTKVIYHVSSGSRDHITTSFACNAAGGMVPPRVIHKGVRNMAAAHLQNLPEDGLSGKWNFSVSPKGYITRPLFLEVLKDINSFVEQNTIQKPVIVILDGASPHLSIEAAAYCKANQIQPWLLRPNMTHLTQPLDLVFFADLKKTFKKHGLGLAD